MLLNGLSGLYVTSSNYCSISENSILHNELYGIQASNSAYSNFTDNTVEFNDVGGIYLSGVNSINSTINNNSVAHSYWDDEYTDIFGIQVEGTINTTVSNNNIYNNTDIGLYLYQPKDAIIIGNNITGQNGRLGLGVWIEGYETLVFTQNNVSGNAKFGIWFYNADNFDVYLNFIANNGWGQVFCEDMGHSLGYQYLFGLYWNYWGDYVVRYPSATQTNWIWNTPYQVNSTGMYDYYPLVGYTTVKPNVPDRPELLTQSQTVFDTNITLAWQPIVGATSYLIYVNATYNQTVATTQCVMQLYFIGEFHYYITAVNATGQSLQSNIVSIERLQGTKDVFLWSANWSTFVYYGEGGLGQPRLTQYNGFIYSVSEIITNVTGFSDHYGYLYAKWDPEGNLLWNRTLDLPQFGGFSTFDIWVSKLGVFICGEAIDFDTGDTMAFLTKIDMANGNIIWTNNVTGPNWGNAIYLTEIGGYIFTVGLGEASNNVKAGYDLASLFLVKWDPSSGAVLNYQLWNPYLESYEKLCGLWTDGVSIYIVGTRWTYDSEYYADMPKGFVAKLSPINFAVAWITLLEDTIYEKAISMAAEGTSLYIYLLSHEGNRIMIVSAINGAIQKSEVYPDLDPIYIDGMAIFNGNLFVYGSYYVYDARESVSYSALVRLTMQVEIVDIIVFTKNTYFTAFCYTDGAIFMFNIEEGRYIPNPSWNQRFISLVRYQLELLPYPPVAPILLTPGQTVAVFWIILEWIPSNGATGYEIYVNGVKVATVTGTTYNLTFLGNGTYIIHMRAINAVGNSVNSNTITVIVAIPPSLREEPSNLLPFIIGGAMAGSVIGIAGANTLTPEKLEKFRKRRYKRFFESRGDKMATTSDLAPQATSSSPSSTTIAAEAVPAASYKDLIDKLRIIWDQIPSELRDGVVKAVDKYYKFKDEAVILVYNSFKGLSNGLFNACELLRQGKLQDALLKLDEVSKNAMEKKFTDLAEEATVLSKEHVKGGKS
jgi:parallel beta-helix repeat protein